MTETTSFNEVLYLRQQLQLADARIAELETENARLRGYLIKTKDGVSVGIGEDVYHPDIDHELHVEYSPDYTYIAEGDDYSEAHKHDIHYYEERVGDCYSTKEAALAAKGGQ